MKKRKLYGKVPNLIGQRFGKLFVVSASSKSGKTYLCKCDCGNTKTINGKYILLDNIKSCGCTRGMKLPNDLTGYRFGNWTVLGISEGKFCNRKQLWQCLCDCGTIVNKSADTIKSHRHKKCTKCANNGPRQQIGEITNRYWKRVVDSARVRHIPLCITKDYAWDLFLQQNRRCSLTGEILVFAKSYEGTMATQQTASLDRIDSSKGYIIGNVQWVHRVINKMKNNLSDKDLIEWCSRIVQHKRP